MHFGHACLFAALNVHVYMATTCLHPNFIEANLPKHALTSLIAVGRCNKWAATIRSVLSAYLAICELLSLHVHFSFDHPYNTGTT